MQRDICRFDHSCGEPCATLQFRGAELGVQGHFRDLRLPLRSEYLLLTFGDEEGGARFKPLEMLSEDF